MVRCFPLWNSAPRALTSGMRIRSRGTATMLACVERLVTEVQRSFAPFILERQVTAAADIQACLVTGSSQPSADARQAQPSSCLMAGSECTRRRWAAGKMPALVGNYGQIAVASEPPATSSSQAPLGPISTFTAPHKKRRRGPATHASWHKGARSFANGVVRQLGHQVQFLRAVTLQVRPQIYPSERASPTRLLPEPCPPARRRHLPHRWAPRCACPERPRPAWGQVCASAA